MVEGAVAGDVTPAPKSTSVRAPGLAQSAQTGPASGADCERAKYSRDLLQRVPDWLCTPMSYEAPSTDPRPMSSCSILPSLQLPNHILQAGLASFYFQSIAVARKVVYHTNISLAHRCCMAVKSHNITALADRLLEWYTTIATTACQFTFAISPLSSRTSGPATVDYSRTSPHSLTHYIRDHSESGKGGYNPGGTLAN